MHGEVLLKKILGSAGARDGGYVLALDGEGLDELPEQIQTPYGAWTVVRPMSELDLRYKLWRAGGGPLVAVLRPELASSLPPDLVRRSVSRRVVGLDPTDVIAAVLNVPVHGLEDDDVKQLALEHLDSLQALVSERTLPTVIDRRLLDELLLDVCVGSQLRKTESAGRLLAQWLRHPPQWSPPVVRLVRRNLPRVLGVEGKLLAWSLEPDAEPEGPSHRRRDGRRTALVVRGLLLAIDVDELPAAVWEGELEQVRGSGVVDVQDELTLRHMIAGVAVDAVDALDADARPYLIEAETLARRLLSPRQYARSRHLPLGLQSQCHALVERLASGIPVSAADIDEVRAHRSAAMMQHELAVLEEMARLSRWLASPKPETEADNAVQRHVLEYLRDGAFADLTALNLMRAQAQTATWEREATALVDRWRERRNRDNEAFAHRLAGGYVERWHADGVVPLHRMWSEAVLQHSPSRRTQEGGGLLLVVMDGCSYPVFLDLLHQLTEPSFDIGLATGTDRAEGLATVAPLPSITGHARGAIFLGELPDDPWAAEKAWREEGERKTDSARLQQNRALGDRSRALFLKGDLSDNGQRLREAIAAPQPDVVAVVFNAVDDLIGGHATGVLSRLRPEEIQGFVPTLRAAFEAGREVVLVADHGHTPFLGKYLCVGSGTSARWCTLEEGEDVPDGFLEIDVQRLGGPPGRKAFAWKMGVYRGRPHVGFHGGASLEELVVPVAWVRRGGTGADLPVWWYESKTDAPPVSTVSQDEVGPVEPEPKRKPKRRPKAPAAGQLEMYDVRRTQAALAQSSSITQLGLPEHVLAELDDQAKATLVALCDNGSATTGELARIQQRSLARVNGYMTKLRRQLHRLGVRCFERDELPTGEAQYRWIDPSGHGGGRE